MGQDCASVRIHYRRVIAAVQQMHQRSGFDPEGHDVVDCHGVDPVGLLVEFLGLRK